MIITDLEIKDFGRHKHVKASIQYPVVGLLGKNGFGKSTILDAIRFAFTGNLTDKAETYVRNFGMENGAKNGSVRIKFIKDGKVGMIFRQVGTTPKRELVWDGCKPVTAAKTVDSMLADIFSANKDAVGTVVFIKQGELDKLLFGTPSERADLFLKMLLLDFLPKRAELIKQKIDTLSAGVTDYSALQDDLRTQRDEAEAALVSLKSQLAAMPDKSELLENVSRWILQADSINKLSDTRRDLTAYITDKQAAFSSEHSRLCAALEGMEHILGGDKYDTPEDTMRALKDTIQEQSMLALNLQFAKDNCARFDKLNEQKSDAQDLLILTSMRVQARTTKLDALPSEDSVNAAIQREHERARLDKSVAEARDKLDEALEKQEALEKSSKVWSESELEEAATLHKKASEDMHLVELQLTLFEAAKTARIDGCCPLCNSPANMEVTDELITETKYKLDACRVLEASKRKTWDVMRADNDRAKFNAKWAKDNINSCRLSLDTAKNALAQLPTSTSTLAEMEQMVKQVREAVEALRQAVTDEEQLQKSIAGYDSELNSITPEMHKGMVAYSAMPGPSPVNAVNERIAFLQSRYDAAQPLLGIVTSLNDSLILKKAELTAAEANFNEACRESYRLAQMLDLGADPSSVAMQKQADLKLHQDGRSQLVGRVSQATQTANDIRAKQAEVERRVENDQRRRALIENLRQLKETLSRGGLPMTVMDHQFKQLVELVQEHLADLGANFAVSADPDRPISFCFTRTDEESGYVMPQEKLSGGQRVRLTVAMLMAVQQLIIPEVGFLVLDEPSVHLDEEGVESLRELFQTLSSRMGSTGSQVIVCDHDQSLKSAFSGLIEIKQ